MNEKELFIEENLPLQPVSQLSKPEHPLMLKDKWHGQDDLGMRVSQHTSHHAIYFDKIRPAWFKNVVKRYILYSCNQGKAFRSLSDSICILKKFGGFLETQWVNSWQEITDEIFSGYLGSLQTLSEQTRRTHLSELKIFFETGSVNEWFNVSTYWFKGKLKSLKTSYLQIKYIPNEVLLQLDKHLHILPLPLQRMVILFRALGLRACELLQMRFDCLRQRQDGEWELHFTNWKFRERLDTLPIIPEIGTLNLLLTQKSCP